MDGGHNNGLQKNQKLLKKTKLGVPGKRPGGKSRDIGHTDMPCHAKQE
jgi:hypothetical protein